MGPRNNGAIDIPECHAVFLGVLREEPLAQRLYFPTVCCPIMVDQFDDRIGRLLAASFVFFQQLQSLVNQHSFKCKAVTSELL